MKKKTLLASLVTIALCISIIAGSTYALFTDSKDVNIAITSGNVEVDATLDVTSIWSAEAATTAEDKYLIDEYGHNYVHADRTPYGSFTNGGTVECDGQTITINKITPGDKVVANIVVENVGDVSMRYRYKIVANNTKLADGIVLTADDTIFEAAHSYTSAWSDVVVENAAAIEHEIAFELPVYAGNEYQSEVGDLKDVAYTITVEAVQGNATMDEDSTPYESIINVNNRDELQIALNNNYDAGKAYTINVLGDIIGNVTVTQRANVQYTINGNGKLFDGALIINGRAAAINNVNATVTINDFNFYSTDALEGTDAYINFGLKSNTSLSYVRGVTVNDCTFSGNGLVAMRDGRNGNFDLTINNCVVNEGMHSLLQVKYFDSITVNNTVVNSKNGINLDNSKALEMNNCKFDVQGYAVRVGEGGSAAVNNDAEKFFNITNCILKSDCQEADDAVIIVRNSSAWSTLTIVDTTLEGNVIFDCFYPDKTTIYEIDNPYTPNQPIN